MTFPDHGGGHCQRSDKGRLNCYGHSNTDFKIKGSSPNSTEVTLYKYMSPNSKCSQDHLDVILYKSSIQLLQNLQYIAVTSNKQALQILLKTRLIFSVFIDDNSEITIFFQAFPLLR